MAINVSSDNDGSMVEMNTTPLIDVMLVLLVMLIITLPPITHAVKLDMPRPVTTPPDTLPNKHEIIVDFDGRTLWDNEEINHSTLLSYLNAAAHENPQPELHLRPNKRVKYSYVAAVLADAQRLGVRKLGFVGNEQFMD